jgi:hypothetical protein
MGYIGAGISRFNTVNGLSVNADGPTVTGIKDEDNMASNSAVKLATQQSIKAYVDSQIGANNELSEVLANGSTTGGNDISFGDADRAYFGAGNDLEIFSDGNTSYIKENGSGDLRIWADNPNIATAGGNKIFYGNNGVAELYYTGGVKRLETTSGGISVTGTVAATSYTGDGSSLTGINTDLVSDTTPQLGGNLDLNNSDITGTGDINITGTLTSTGLDLNGNGDVSGNLVVNGLLMAVNGVARTTANTQDALVFTTGEGLMKLNARGSIRYDIDNNANGTGQYHEFTTNDGGASLLKMQDSTGAVFNETGQDLDFRVESNNNTHMLFVEAGTDRVGINQNDPDDTFEVNGTILSGVSATQGGPILAQRYGANGPVGSGDYLGIISSHASSGALKIGYGLMGTSSESNASSYDNFSGGRSAVDFNQSTITFRNDTANSSTTVGTAVTTQRLLQLGRSEASFNDDGNDIDFRVESNGNAHMLFVDAGNNRVGIRNSGPARKLDVSGDDLNAMRIRSDTNGGWAGIEFVDNLPGMSQLGYIRHSHSDANTLSATGQSGGAAFLIGSTESETVVGFNVSMGSSSNGTSCGSIKATTSGTTYNTTSDIRLKTDIAPISDATDKLMAMNAVTHKWKAEPNADAVHGFIAQEMAEIVPEAVSGDPDSEGMMSMDYGRITPVIVAALQEANKKIAELETRIKELETK